MIEKIEFSEKDGDTQAVGLSENLRSPEEVVTFFGQFRFKLATKIFS